MKKLADDAIKWLNDRMESHTDSRCASEGEVYMAAMSCRIQELETALTDVVSVAEECDGWESFPSETLVLAQTVLS